VKCWVFSCADRDTKAGWTAESPDRDINDRRQLGKVDLDLTSQICPVAYVILLNFPKIGAG